MLRYGKRIPVKRIHPFVTIFLLVICLSAKADLPIFGNAPDGNGSAYDVSWYNYTSSGGAVAFTPDQNITLSSVTVWLQGYTGQNGLSLDAAIYNNFQGQPGQEIDVLTSPEPNDGSISAFNFSSSSGSTVLDAGDEYWLLLYGNGTNPMDPTGCHWEEGGSPTGAAAYDGTQGFYEPYTDTPAFTINAVPEPGVGSLVALGLLLGLGRLLSKRAKARLQALQLLPFASSRKRRRQCESSTKLMGF
jgi:hypothetical protein